MDIVLCADNNYAMPCGVTITSVLENNKDIPITFHIIGMELNEEVKAEFLSIPSIYNKASVQLYEIKKDFMESCNFVVDNTYLSIASYMRLFLGDILPKDITKVLYLDCDVIVRGSLSELWNTDIENYSVAGASDLNVEKNIIELIEKLGYPEAYGYINAGVLLVNVAYWRRNEMTISFLNFFKEIDWELYFHDQDLINGLLYDTKLFLPIKYNVMECYYLNEEEHSQYGEEVYAAMEEPLIIHYSARKKPWVKSNLHPLRDEFLKYKSLSLWKDVPLKWWKRPLSDKIKYYKRLFLFALKLKKRIFITVKKDANTGKYILNR